MTIDAADLAVAVASLESFDGLDIPAELSAQFLAFGDLIVTEGQANASTRMEARAAGTLTAENYAEGVAVILGGDSGVPYALGAEFGAGHNMPRSTVRWGHEVDVQGWNQFRPWTSTGGSEVGYFLHPAVRDVFEAANDPLMDALVELVGRKLDD